MPAETCPLCGNGFEEGQPTELLEGRKVHSLCAEAQEDDPRDLREPLP